MSMNIENLNPQELAALIKRANSRRKVLAKRKPAAQAKAAVAKVFVEPIPTPHCRPSQR